MSRPVRPSPFGKRTSKTQTLVSPYTKEKLGELWRDLGYMTESEFLAELIEVRVHGFDQVMNIHAERLKKIAGIGDKSDE